MIAVCCPLIGGFSADVRGDHAQSKSKGICKDVPCVAQKGQAVADDPTNDFCSKNQKGHDKT